MKPRIVRKGKVTQTSYELSHRVHTATIYPLKAPNRSTVVLYGHEFGVRILWRGGRPFRSSPVSRSPHNKSKVNGTAKDAVMIIDSDDEEPAQHPSGSIAHQESGFESEEEEFDPSQPAPSIIQYLDIELSSPVFRIATPSLKGLSPDTSPRIFGTKITFAAACADNSIKVISLPLVPPTDAQKAEGTGSQVLEIKGQNGHQDVPNAITVSWTSRFDISDDQSDSMEYEDEEENTQSPRISRRKSAPVQLRSQRRRNQAQEGSEEWDLLLASHSTELNGIIRIYRIPLHFDGKQHSISNDQALPYQTLFLTSPASHLYFSPAAFPSHRHSRLLIVQPKGSLRIYDPLASSPNQQGSWIAQYSTPFVAPKQDDFDSAALAQRKKVLDAVWTTGGRNVFALLSDGEWGIWDIDQSGPATSKFPQESGSARSLNSFALHGYLSSTAAISSGLHSSPSRPHSAGSAASSTKTTGTHSGLAPMTPNTRRAKEDKLFRGPSSSASNVIATSPISSYILPRGGLSVRSTFSQSGGIPEDSIVIWHGSEAFRISSLSHFWSRSAASGGNKGSGGTLFGPGLTRLDELDLMGEMIQNVDQFENDAAAAGSKSSVTRDVLVVTDHRLLVLSGATPISAGTAEASTGLFGRSRAVDEERARGLEQNLLKRGELDIGGMDRLLDSMAGFGAGSGGGGRRVGFASGSGA